MRLIRDVDASKCYIIEPYIRCSGTLRNVKIFMVLKNGNNAFLSPRGNMCLPTVVQMLSQGQEGVPGTLEYGDRIGVFAETKLAQLSDEELLFPRFRYVGLFCNLTPFYTRFDDSVRGQIGNFRSSHFLVP